MVEFAELFDIWWLHVRQDDKTKYNTRNIDGEVVRLNQVQKINAVKEKRNQTDVDKWEPCMCMCVYRHRYTHMSSITHATSIIRWCSRTSCSRSTLRRRNATVCCRRWQVCSCLALVSWVHACLPVHVHLMYLATTIVHRISNTQEPYPVTCANLAWNIHISASILERKLVCNVFRKLVCNVFRRWYQPHIYLIKIETQSVPSLVIYTGKIHVCVYMHDVTWHTCTCMTWQARSRNVTVTYAECQWQHCANPCLLVHVLLQGPAQTQGMCARQAGESDWRQSFGGNLCANKLLVFHTYVCTYVYTYTHAWDSDSLQPNLMWSALYMSLHA